MVSKDKLLQVIREFYIEGLPKDIRPREGQFVEKIGNATIIKGMRRTGKTYRAYGKMQELLSQGLDQRSIVHVNFDDERLGHMDMDDFGLINELHAELFPEKAAGECWYFLDEMQNVKGWEPYVRRLLETRKIHVCLTGSSSRLLSEEIATQMRGRSRSMEIFPLSFREFLSFNSIADKPASKGLTALEKGLLVSSLKRYALEGGFPDVQGGDARNRIATLQDYLKAVIYRDIVERHSIGSLQAFSATLEYVIHNFGRKISARNISGLLKNQGFPANRESVADYLDYMADAYLAYPVSIRSESMAIKRANPKKYYLVDSGLINAVCPKVAIEKGMLLENMVYMALRKGDNIIEYYVTKSGLEVDFHVFNRITKDLGLVQVSYDLSSAETLAREIEAMKEARKETGIKDCVIVTWEGEEKSLDGIRIVPACKWLLEQ